LTLLYTPASFDYFQEQSSQDFGRHEIKYGLVAHRGDYREGKSYWRARRHDQPLLAFTVPKHGGALGKSFTLFSTNSDQVAIQAIKQAEDGTSFIVRLQELNDQAARIKLTAPSDILGAQEVTGSEEPISALAHDGKTLELAFEHNQLRTLGIALSPIGAVAKPQSKAIALDYDLDAISFNGTPGDGDMNGSGANYPAEMLPEELQVGGVIYHLGPRANGQLNALSAKGQTIKVPDGYTRLYVLCASASPGLHAQLRVGSQPFPFDVAGWTGYVGQWDNRVFAGHVREVTFSVTNPLTRIAPAYLLRDRLAWFASHYHRGSEGDVPYAYSYLFSYTYALPPRAKSVTLPVESQYRIFAISVTKDDNAGALALSALEPRLTRDEAFHMRFDTL